MSKNVFENKRDLVLTCAQCMLRALVILSCILKSVNLEYNTLVRWADGTNVLSTKCLMFQVFFSHKILQNSLQKAFRLILLFLL